MAPTISKSVARTSVLIAAIRTYLSNKLVSFNNDALYKPYEQPLVKQYAKYCYTNPVDLCSDVRLTIIDPYALFFIRHESSPDILAEFFHTLPKFKPTVDQDPLYQSLISSGLDVSSVDSIAHFFKSSTTSEAQIMQGWTLLFDEMISNHVSCRTRLIDEFVLEGVSNGIKQVVILGSGLDTRAQRLPLDHSVTVFEVDVAEVVEYKRHVMESAMLAIEPISKAKNVDIKEDLRYLDTWTSKLKESGFQTDKPSIWILEGLLMYLQPEHTANLLNTISPMSSSGSAMIIQTTGVFDRTVPNYFGKNIFQQLAEEVFIPAPRPDELLTNIGFTNGLTTLYEKDLIKMYGTPGAVYQDPCTPFQRFTKSYKP
ncbi:hypothetical protein SAMD00019534_001680 [Acytostelium subglobosum LB1]|uniref:hypothetical protein n=1 Tax=Acytostelium subglobosum LB1 TaxID=1410327 RepID=UPI000644C521|nr:hypothetical protein SAMD00019534_001680 [Acytostelium subglobosum LB1]GAM16993.1 hypothetical protein SAMD00019534_001680 [Acytostelium subglobosum LB1]|eukprot:XP_012759055.1 hypothetical protein SAMD00019534_001680 [Acytostelium subglobosum LB1]